MERVQGSSSLGVGGSRVGRDGIAVDPHGVGGFNPGVGEKVVGCRFYWLYWLVALEGCSSLSWVRADSPLSHTMLISPKPKLR